MERRGERTAREVRESGGVRWVEEPQNTPAEAAFAEIFVNVGRRDGVTPSDFQRALADLGGIAESLVGPIRIRERSSFVSVKRETMERALAVLNGATICGRVAQAELARARSSGTSSTNDG